MRAGRVVAFELVVDLGGRAEGLLQVVRTAQGRRAVDAVHLQHRFGDVDVGRVVVQLLANQLVAEHGSQILGARDLAVRQPDGLRLLRHVGPQVVPLRRDLVFAQVQTMRCLFGHGRFLSNRSVPRLARRGCSQSASVRAARTKRAPGSPRALLISMYARTEARGPGINAFCSTTMRRDPASRGRWQRKRCWRQVAKGSLSCSVSGYARQYSAPRREM